MVAAMEQQFRPLIRKPMDLREVKRLCEQEARESTNDLCMLAILNAYLGEREQALSAASGCRQCLRRLWRLVWIGNSGIGSSAASCGRPLKPGTSVSSWMLPRQGEFLEQDSEFWSSGDRIQWH